tara:strand:- start:462 stop:1295 length:834 start_codon:yes stop_codon:yes gene_type:complete
MKSIQLKSNSKINLGLKVLSKTKSGYHNIETIFHEVKYFDTINLTRVKKGIEFSSNANWLKNDESNLCVKAYNAISSNYKIGGLKIDLCKNIPAGSGLGGGSSNAASIIKGLDFLYNLKIGNEKLKKIGFSIGADVPFFIEGGTQYGIKFGELLTPINLKLNFKTLIILTNFHISTEWAFNALKIPLERKNNLVKFKSYSKSDLESCKFFENDFESIVFPAYPEIGHIKAVLKSMNAKYASLSGTGSTVFGIFDDDASLMKAKSHFSSSYKTFIPSP